ncbi:sugar phosphate isomerase/epimerase family protein [Paenibacillus sp. GCM10023252]|uniref:sugar phosphate isomerase/epimerase family protein n=1 Tax=Paenibacillus sp. GCM10023252 TaxID=3252649 RepID=UPI00361B704A
MSTYSYYAALKSGEMTALEVVDTIAELGAVHVEIVPLGYELSLEQPSLIHALRERASLHGLVISNYAVSANFSGLRGEAFEAEVLRLCREVDIAHALGAKRMRHDVASSQDTSMAHLMSELPKLAEACRRVADYAAGYGMVSSVENHGYYMQGSDRVLALLDAVGHPSFKTTVDIGNFMCADEDSVAAVKKMIGYASMVHLKDFYLRRTGEGAALLGEGWFRTASGNSLRGAIVGQGDIDMPAVLGVVKQSGYDGFISIEFEGLEDCRLGTRLGFEYARRLWDELG